MYQPLLMHQVLHLNQRSSKEHAALGDLNQGQAFIQQLPRKVARQRRVVSHLLHIEPPAQFADVAGNDIKVGDVSVSDFNVALMHPAAEVGISACCDRYFIQIQARANVPATIHLIHGDQRSEVNLQQGPNPATQGRHAGSLPG